jgi:hypothetical protein
MASLEQAVDRAARLESASMAAQSGAFFAEKLTRIIDLEGEKLGMKVPA